MRNYCGATSLRYNEVQPPQSPRIQHLLSVNEPPLEGEQATLRATVSRGSSALSDLDTQITEVRAVLDALLRDRAQAAANIQDAKHILHPIRRLPEDILREIFSSCVYPQEDYLYKNDTGIVPCLDDGNPRWTLSQTCRRWRYVALGTSSLWSCIDIDFDGFTRAQSMRVAFKLGLNVERSGSRNLMVRIRSQSDIVAIPPLLSCPPVSGDGRMSILTCLPIHSMGCLFAGDCSIPSNIFVFDFMTIVLVQTLALWTHSNSLPTFLSYHLDQISIFSISLGPRSLCTALALWMSVVSTR